MMKLLTSILNLQLDLPPIRKGASLVIAYRLEGRRVLLIGGGTIASGRLYYLLEAGAHVTVVSPLPLDPTISHRLVTNTGDITHVPRTFRGRDDAIKVEDYAMVLTAIDDVTMSREICALCREKRVPVNVADIPPSCDFYFGAQLRRGPLQILISTGGSGPKIGSMVRDIVEDSIPEGVEDAIEGIGLLRSDLRQRAVGVGGEVGKKRMKWMVGICEAWGLGQMGEMRDDQVRKKVLDDGWDQGEVVRPEQMGFGKPRRRVPERAQQSSLWSVGITGLVSGMALGIVGTMWLVRRTRT